MYTYMYVHLAGVTVGLDFPVLTSIHSKLMYTEPLTNVLNETNVLYMSILRVRYTFIYICLGMELLVNLV